MPQVRISVFLAITLAQPAVATAATRMPLHPRPQEVRYGSGRLTVRGLSIRFASPPGPEERFAARELSSTLSKRAGVKIPIQGVGPRGPAILMERTGSVEALPVANERAGPASREAYSLKVTHTGAEVRARSSAGLYYGVQTLSQLVEGAGARAILPEVEIRDWPSLAYRGVMMDMSHGPLLTEDEVKRQIDFLARWKANQYYFYSEAGIEFQGYPELNPQARFTQEAVRRIVAYARERHVDVVPCMELYGHLHDLFRVERYAGLAELPHGGEFDPRQPQVTALLDSWVDQVAHLFPSTFFHIGFDETWEVKRLAAKSHASPAGLYFQHFKSVSNLVRRHGKTVLVWSDMLAKNPELIPRIPPGTIIVPWGYDATVYEPYWKPFADLPLPKFIATGVSIWNQVAPDFDVSFSNIDNFLRTGRQHGILGLINTLWTDDVTVLERPAFPGIAYGAVAAWQSQPVDRPQFFANYAAQMYTTTAATEVAAALQQLAQAESHLANAVGEQTMRRFWDDPLVPARLTQAQGHQEEFRRTRIAAEIAEGHLNQALKLGGDRDTLSDLLLEAQMLDYAGMKKLYALEIADFWRQLGAHPSRDDLEFYVSGEIASHDHSRIADLMDTIGNLRESYHAAWLASYAPYRLGTVLGKFDGEFQYWWRLKRRLENVVQNFHAGDTLPPLETFSPKQEDP